MAIAFAICFFFYAGLSETLRHGVFGLSPDDAATARYAVLLFCAALILRGDLLSVLRPPRHALYGDARLNWSWPRTVLSLLLAPLILVLPMAYGLDLTRIPLLAQDGGALAGTAVYQAVAAALAVELFFREAALKAFSGSLAATVIASALAGFIYHLPEGLPAAAIAAAFGLYFLALRLIGTGILAVVLIHAAAAVTMPHLLPQGASEAEMWRYAIYFTAAAAGLSLTVASLLAPKRKETRYA